MEKQKQEVSLPKKEQDYFNDESLIEMIGCFKDDLHKVMRDLQTGKCDRKNCLKNLYDIGKLLQSEFNIRFNVWMDE